MKTTSLHIAFAALLSLLSFASCSRNDEVAVAEGEEGKVQVTFTLKLDNESSASRAMSRAEDNTWGDEYNDDLGNDYDNRINDLQVVIYEGNTFKCKVTNLSFYKNEEKNEYTYLGSISETLTANTVYKIMVFANCADITSETDLSALSYTYSENMDIPMWGVITQTLSLEPGSRQELDEISLLRAFAKVEVNFAESFPSNYEIGSITINPYNTQGYCLPAGYASVDATGKLDREETSPASFNPLDSPSNMELTFKGENNSYYIYLPEYDNSTKPAKIQVTVNGETYYLEFKDYENGVPTGDPYDIVRNHIYRYTITGVNDGKLVIQYWAMPWELVTSEIGYAPEPMTTNPFSNEDEYETFISNGESKYILLPLESYRVEEKDGKVVNDYSNTQKLFNHLYENPEVGDNEARLCIITRPTYDDKIDGNQHWALKPGSAGARYYFMLTGPKGATWEAHLNDPEGNFDFSTSVNNGDFKNCTDEGFAKEVRMVTHGIARKQPYIIQIIATHLYTGNRNKPRWSGISDKDAEPRFEDEYEYNVGINKETWKPYFMYDYLTEWGKNKWDAKKVIEAEFYITVKLADGVEYELTINPSYSPKDDEKKNFPFYNKETGTYHRFAGTETRIWIRQIRAQYDCPNLEYLAWEWNVEKNEDDLNKDGYIGEWEKKSWWNKNRYWNPDHVWK